MSEPTPVDQLKLMWRRGAPAPKGTSSQIGAAVAHGDTAYFSYSTNVYSFRVSDNTWTKLPLCSDQSGAFSLAIVKDLLTTIGGMTNSGTATNSLLSYSGKIRRWETVLPPMPTSRASSAAATTPTHLVIAGGKTKIRDYLATVEVLNTETLQWSTACDLPRGVDGSQMTLCNGRFYFSGNAGRVYDNFIWSCSFEDLLDSCKPTSTKSRDGCCVWTRLADIPVHSTRLTTLKGHVLAVGGDDGDHPARAIHCYDVASDSWSAISKMLHPRYDTLAAVLSSNDLVVVGGWPDSANTSTEIGTVF